MKTPRELLFQRHRRIEPKLDSLRQDFVGRLKASRTTQVPVLETRVAALAYWRELFRMLRWHIVGLSALWMLVLCFWIAGTGDAPPRVAAQKKQVSSPVILTLKENRRQLSELEDFSGTSSPPVLRTLPQSRRSLLQVDWAYA